MESSQFVRSVDELGRVFLPIEVRRALDWGERTPVAIRVDPTGDTLLIRRHAPCCIFCGHTEELKVFHNRHICPACQGAVARL